MDDPCNELVLLLSESQPRAAALYTAMHACLDARGPLPTALVDALLARAHLPVVAELALETELMLAAMSQSGNHSRVAQRALRGILSSLAATIQSLPHCDSRARSFPLLTAAVFASWPVDSWCILDHKSSTTDPSVTVALVPEGPDSSSTVPVFSSPALRLVLAVGHAAFIRGFFDSEILVSPRQQQPHMAPELVRVLVGRALGRGTSCARLGSCMPAPYARAMLALALEALKRLAPLSSAEAGFSDVRVEVLGLGGGVIPMALVKAAIIDAATHAGAAAALSVATMHVHCVEMSEAVAEAARTWWGVGLSVPTVRTPASEALDVVWESTLVGDAVDAVASGVLRPADVILVDIYSGGELTRAIGDDTFVLPLLRLLRRDGATIIINVPVQRGTELASQLHAAATRRCRESPTRGVRIDVRVSVVDAGNAVVTAVRCSAGPEA